MSKKNFDDLLSNKFEEEDFEYNPQHWENLSKQLTQNKVENKRGRIWSISLGIAAAMALLLSSVLLIRFVQINEPLPNEPLAITYSNNPQPTPTLNTEEKEQENKGLAKKKKEEKEQSFVTKNKEEKNIQKNESLTQASSSPKSQIISEEVQPIKLQGSAEKTKTKVTALNTTEPRRENWNPADNSVAMDHYFKNGQNGSKTSIAIGGGVNYSSLNAGYSLGLSAKQKIGKKFFVDGSIAVLYNNNASNVGSYAGKPARSSSNTLISQSSPAFSSWNNLFYMQVNPSFGYQVSEFLGLSFGGDLQQLLSSENDINKIQFTDQGVRVFPTLDLGVTGKAEFDLGKHIQTGIIYREGVNNLFNEQSIPYVNRRYIQVQFKYNIPIK